MNTLKYRKILVPFVILVFSFNTLGRTLPVTGQSEINDTLQVQSFFSPIIKHSGWRRERQIELELDYIITTLLFDSTKPWHDINGAVDKWICEVPQAEDYRFLNVVSIDKGEGGQIVINLNFLGDENSPTFVVNVPEKAATLFEAKENGRIDVIDKERRLRSRQAFSVKGKDFIVEEISEEEDIDTVLEGWFAKMKGKNGMEPRHFLGPVRHRDGNGEKLPRYLVKIENSAGEVVAVRHYYYGDYFFLTGDRPKTRPVFQGAGMEVLPNYRGFGLGRVLHAKTFERVIWRMELERMKIDRDDELAWLMIDEDDEEGIMTLESAERALKFHQDCGFDFVADPVYDAIPEEHRSPEEIDDHHYYMAISMEKAKEHIKKVNGRIFFHAFFDREERDIGAKREQLNLFSDEEMAELEKGEVLLKEGGSGDAEVWRPEIDTNEESVNPLPKQLSLFEDGEIDDLDVGMIGKRAWVNKLDAEKETAEFEDVGGKTFTVDLMPHETVDIAILKDKIKKLDEVSLEGKETLLSFLSLLENSPPVMLYRYSEVVEDLFGFASRKNSLIALHEDLANDPIAQVHELFEYFSSPGTDGDDVLGVAFKPGMIAKIANKIGIYPKLKSQNWMFNGKAVLSFGGVSKNVPLKGEALSIALKTYDGLLRDKEHYYLRAVQRQLLGVYDRELTGKIKKRFARERYNGMRGIITGEAGGKDIYTVNMLDHLPRNVLSAAKKGQPIAFDFSGVYGFRRRSDLIDIVFPGDEQLRMVGEKISSLAKYIGEDKEMQRDYPGIDKKISVGPEGGKTGEVTVTYLEFVLRELMKNAVVHGNHLNLHMPVVVYFDKDNGRVSVYDMADKGSGHSRKNAEENSLSGFSRGLIEIQEDCGLRFEYDNPLKDRDDKDIKGARAVVTWPSGESVSGAGDAVTASKQDKRTAEEKRIDELKSNWAEVAVSIIGMKEGVYNTTDFLRHLGKGNGSERIKQGLALWIMFIEHQAYRSKSLTIDEFIENMYSSVGLDGILENVEDYGSVIEDGRQYIALRDGKGVGCVSLILKAGRDGPSIENLAVVPMYQRRGIGHDLMDKAVDAFLSAVPGINEFEVHSLPGSDEWYEKYYFPDRAEGKDTRSDWYLEFTKPKDKYFDVVIRAKQEEGPERVSTVGRFTREDLIALVQNIQMLFTGQGGGKRDVVAGDMSLNGALAMMLSRVDTLKEGVEGLEGMAAFKVSVVKKDKEGASKWYLLVDNEYIVDLDPPAELKLRPKDIVVMEKREAARKSEFYKDPEKWIAKKDIWEVAAGNVEVLFGGRDDVFDGADEIIKEWLEDIGSRDAGQGAGVKGQGEVSPDNITLDQLKVIAERLYSVLTVGDSDQYRIPGACMTLNCTMGKMLGSISVLKNKNGYPGKIPEPDIKIIYKEIGDGEHWYVLVDDKYVVDIFPAVEVRRAHGMFYVDTKERAAELSGYYEDPLGHVAAEQEIEDANQRVAEIRKSSYLFSRAEEAIITWLGEEAKIFPTLEEKERVEDIIEGTAKAVKRINKNKMVEGMLNEAFSKDPNKEIDFTVDLSLIPEKDIEANLETWAYLVLMFWEHKNINFVFNIPEPRTKGRTGITDKPDSLTSDLDHAANQAEWIAELKKRVLDKISLKVVSREEVNRRIKGAGFADIKISIMSRAWLEWQKENNLPLAKGQYPVSMDGPTITGKTDIALYNLHAAMNIGLSQAALVLTKERDENTGSRDLPELRRNICKMLHGLYEVLLGDKVDLTEETLDYMISPDSIVRLNRALEFSLPEMVRMPVRGLVYFHDAVQRVLFAA